MDNQIEQIQDHNHDGVNSRKISISNVEGDVDLSTRVTGTLPIAKGGTGATTASGARSNLGISATAACRVYLANNQTISHNTTGNVLWEGLDFDTDSIANLAGANPDRLVVPAGLGGKWMMNAGVRFAGNVTGRRRLQIQAHIGANNIERTVNDVNPVPSANPIDMKVCETLSLSAGDYVILRAFQNSGGDLDIVGDDGSGIYCYCDFFRISD